MGIIQQSLQLMNDLKSLLSLCAQKSCSCYRTVTSVMMEGSRQTRVSRPYKISESSKRRNHPGKKSM
uniref:Kelch like family member 36 n=1 Tax=Molossus molossus TaxID=27622 RepID=A0A7J8C899_MOLMO|nr:kelch like family member 36 [Molossus molossus]